MGMCGEVLFVAFYGHSRDDEAGEGTPPPAFSHCTIRSSISKFLETCSPIFSIGD